MKLSKEYNNVLERPFIYCRILQKNRQQTEKQTDRDSENRRTYRIFSHFFLISFFNKYISSELYGGGRGGGVGFLL